MKQYQCIFLTSILLLSACAKDEQVKAETVPRAPASTSSSSVAAQAAVAATAQG